MSIGRIVKISAITISTLIVVTGLALVAMVTIVNPNNYKPLIIKAVNSSTGRELALDGDITWKLWPNIGLHLEKVSLSNPKGFTAANLVSATSAEISVQLMPLLEHKIIVNSLKIDGLNLDLVKNGDINNWTFSSVGTPGPAGESTPPTPMHLELNAFTITNSTVTYSDLKTREHYAVNNFDFKLKANSGGVISMDQDKETLSLKNVDFDFSNIISGTTNFTLKNFSNPAFSGDIKIPEFSLLKLLAKTNYSVKAISNKPLFDKVSLSTSFDSSNSNLKLMDTSFSLGSSLKGQMDAVINNLKNPQYTGNINLAEFSINNVLDGLNVSKAGREKNAMLDKFSFKSKFNGNSTSATLQQFTFSFPSLLNGTGSIKIPDFTKTSYIGNINLPVFSLNQVMQASGMKAIDIPNKQLLNSVAFQSNLAGGTNNINLTNIVAKVSDTNVNGNLNVTSISPLQFSQNLNIDKIELSDLTDTYGYKLPLTGIHAQGNASIGNTDNLATLNSSQGITVQNVTVLGFSLDSLIANLDQAITSTGKAITLDNLQQINNSVQVVNSIKTMQAAIAKAQTKGAKDYNQKTNFGNLAANLMIKNGVANPAVFKLSGPSIKSAGQGTVNLSNKTLNYTVSTLLITPQHNDILNSIVFPYNIAGKFDNPQGSLDWTSIQKQLVEYLLKNTGQAAKSIAKSQLNQVIQTQIPDDNTGVKQGITNVVNSLFK